MLDDWSPIIIGVVNQTANPVIRIGTIETSLFVPSPLDPGKSRHPAIRPPYPVIADPDRGMRHEATWAPSADPPIFGAPAPCAILPWSKSEQIAHSCVIPGAPQTRYQMAQHRCPERDDTLAAQICALPLRGHSGCDHHGGRQRRRRLPFRAIRRRGAGPLGRALACRLALDAADRHRHFAPRAPSCGRHYARGAAAMSLRCRPGHRCHSRRWLGDSGCGHD
jgi:hypothetical protein